MIDCKTKENYLREQNRMCCSCNGDCSSCVFGFINNGCYVHCSKFKTQYAQKAIAIVQAWSDAHPVKTYLSDFLEKFPNAGLEKNGVPICTCPKRFYGKKAEYSACNMGKNCVACWNRPLEG